LNLAATDATALPILPAAPEIPILIINTPPL